MNTPNANHEFDNPAAGPEASVTFRGFLPTRFEVDQARDVAAAFGLDSAEFVRTGNGYEIALVITTRVSTRAALTTADVRARILAAINCLG